MTLDEYWDKMMKEDFNGPRMVEFSKVILASESLKKETANCMRVQMIDGISQELLMKVISVYTAIYAAGYDAGYAKAMDEFLVKK